ncbi:hypothetical protein ACIRYZ_17840 [Kitasatospora sp. NPDC101155]|uniref:hypothetical protein n=1 Tax=Kitasatospora sp. NPDC101155 TaxID=3364097 RepID=UPI0037F26B6C
MTSSTHLPSPVQVLQVRTLHLVETTAPQLAQEHQLAMDRAWRAATQACGARACTASRSAPTSPTRTPSPH